MAQYKAQGIDQKLVAASVLSNLKAVSSYAIDFSNEQVVELGKRTSTIVIRNRPVVTLVATPAVRDGLLPRTSAAAGFVEVSLSEDVYAKLAIDPLDVEPARQSTELGQAIAEASIAVSNADLLATLVTGGTKSYLGEIFTKTSTPDVVWNAVLAAVANPVATYTPNFTLYVGASFWGRLASGSAALRQSVDPKAQALALSGVQRIRVVPDAIMTAAGALAIVAHSNAAVHGDVLTDLVTNREDADEILFYRIRFGTKVTDPGAVLALVDGVSV
jgi:hypothetical protein